MQAVLFVCLGNICRSPTAEAVLRKQAEQSGLALRVDSAGTGDWNVGEPPYTPSIFAAAARGYDLRALRARVVVPEDFMTFDHVLAMDRSNLRDLQAMRPPNGAEPALLLSYATGLGSDIPDPWYTRDFEQTLDMIEAAISGLLARLKSGEGGRQPPQ